MRAIFALAGLLFAVLPAAGSDSAAPLVAKVRRTITHSPANGPETSIRVDEGVFYRSSKGLTYQSFGDVRGIPPFQIGRLTDHIAGKSFVVQLDRRRVVLRHRFCPDWPPAPPEPGEILGEETVNGIECVILPSKCDGADCGRMWRSKEHDFIVRVESAVPLGGGAKQNVVMEYYDIAIGREPPAAEINFLDRFEVMDNIIPPPECPR